MAWRKLEPLSASILHDVATALSQHDFQHTLSTAYHDTADSHPHHYNHSTMVCLPKKPHTTTGDGTPTYMASNTRPLNVVNADNRIVASAARHKWERALSDWVLPRQQGFLRMRSILTNLLDVDTASMHTSLVHDNGACVLFDFASAFPSISQEYMHKTLRAIGLPSSALHLITALYDQSYCQIVHNGGVGTPFHIRAGVRQGCPLFLALICRCGGSPPRQH